MDSQVKAALLSSLLLLNGCSTVGKSVMLGVTVGGIAGGAMGNSQNPQGGGGVGLLAPDILQTTFLRRLDVLDIDVLDTQIIVGVIL